MLLSAFRSEDLADMVLKIHPGLKLVYTGEGGMTFPTGTS